MIEIDALHTSWQSIRQALSLAMLTNRDTALLHAHTFLTGRPQYRHVLEDLARATAGVGAGRIECESDSILYYPRRAKAGRYELESNSFSSSVEVLLFLMPALFFADFRTVINLKGATHSVLSHPTAFVKEFMLAAIEQLGFYASLTLKRFGFYGSGGGLLESRIYPREIKNALLPAWKSCKPAGARIYLAGLNMELASLEKRMLSDLLGLGQDKIAIIEIVDADGPGNSLHVYADAGGINIIFYREIDICNEEGVAGINEEKISGILAGLSEEIWNCTRNGVLPDRMVRELYPYIALSGSDTASVGKPGEFATTEDIIEKFL
jgi:RNA 3'-terminal phosphate cyclase